MIAAERRAAFDRWVRENHPGQHVPMWTDLDGALIGAFVDDGNVRAVYDWRAMVQTLQEADAIDGEWPDEEEVIDHLCYNTLGTWLGPNTPAVLYEAGEGPGSFPVDPSEVIRLEAM